MSCCGSMDPSASSQMVRGSRAHPVEGMAPRITRIYTYEGCGGLREHRAVWVGADHWRGFEETTNCKKCTEIIWQLRMNVN